METIKVNFPINLAKMSKNSIHFEQNGRDFWIHRNNLNYLLNNPDTPCFVIKKVLSNHVGDWIAIPKTL